MTPKLSVLVQVDPDGRHVTLAVTGTLTEAHQPVLPSLVEQARTAFPDARLTVDLHQAQLHGTTAIGLLARDLRSGVPGSGSVRITAPGRPGWGTSVRGRSALPAGRGQRRGAPRWLRPSALLPRADGAGRRSGGAPPTGAGPRDMR
ncbi:hypothetical protein [Kocuria rosea]|jgi:hypothetical protein|uniref:hypothetical protein n=1 Tax=Kocuria rosea TaxID=1275 RepID=UPI00203BA8E4|nr:hypothetical protein [Kocuria rosea]MCM3689432.1 hypothetical protein [Kocuria rosea]